MNEQMLQRQGEETLSLTLEVSDEALEAAAGNELGGRLPKTGARATEIINPRRTKS